MLFTPLTAILALSGVSHAAAITNSKRDTLTTTLFAYGSGTNGAPIFYADGLAYIGQTPLTANATTQTNVTFAVDTSSTTTTWPITANSTAVTFNETLNLYIIPTTGAFTQVGFAANSSVPTDGVTTGFSWYGTSVAYAASESDYQLMFWAVNTTTTGVYGLYWNAAAVVADIPDGAFPVTVKSTPPTVV